MTNKLWIGGIGVSVVLLAVGYHLAGTPQPSTNNTVKRPASADAWATRAEDLAARGRTPEAVRAMERARELAPRIPAISMRAANLFYSLEDRARLISSVISVLRDSADYDLILFDYLTEYRVDPETVLSQLRDNERARLTYFDYLCHQGNASTAWRWLKENSFASQPAAVAYTRHLVQAGKVAEAAEEWNAWTENTAYIFNGGFHREPTRSPFDWELPAHANVAITLDSGALHLRFNGAENLEYEARHLVWLPAGDYTLTVRARSDAVTTDQGVYVQACDARTPALRGTTPGWQTLTADVHVARAGACHVRIRRDRSRKIDSKIAGVVSIDDVALTPRSR